MITSFRQLHETPKPDETDVVDTMKDYADTGAAIISDIVIEVIKRAGLSRGSLEKCLSASITGIDFHEGWAERTKEPGKSASEMKIGREYAIVAEYIRTHLNSL